jgi:hypothetical protein
LKLPLFAKIGHILAAMKAKKYQDNFPNDANLSKTSNSNPDALLKV